MNEETINSIKRFNIYAGKEIKRLNDEITRLNNVINELEKYMETRGSIDDYNALKYLKELKENK